MAEEHYQELYAEYETPYIRVEGDARLVGKGERRQNVGRERRHFWNEGN